MEWGRRQLFLLLLLHVPPSGAAEACVRTFASGESKSGNFSSPRWPESYPENVRCRFQMRAGPGEVVWVRWTSFHLEGVHKGTEQCLRDYVEVIVTDHQGQQQVSGRYCGRQTPPEFKTMQQNLDIIFQSSHTKHYQGFSGTYVFLGEAEVEPPLSVYPGGRDAHSMGCGGFAQGDHGGVLTNPGFPNTFLSGLDCFWVIRVQRGKQIYIKLVELELSDSLAECRSASLEVLDGYSPLDLRAMAQTDIDRLVDSQQLVQFCGHSEYYEDEGDKSYMSDQNRILVRFKTTSGPKAKTMERRGKYGKPIGFKLVWTEVEGTAVEGSSGTRVLKNEAQTEEECEEFLCAGGEFCVENAKSICAQRRRYCIHKSLVCDGVPHCAESDDSDEENCYSGEILGAGAALFALLILLVLAVVCCQRRANLKDLRAMEARAAADAPAPGPLPNLPHSSLPNGRNRGPSQASNHSPSSSAQPIKALPSNYHGYAAAEPLETAPFLQQSSAGNHVGDAGEGRMVESHFDALPDPPPQFLSSPEQTLVHRDQRKPQSATEKRTSFHRMAGSSGRDILSSASSSVSHASLDPPGQPGHVGLCSQSRVPPSRAFSEAWASSAGPGPSLGAPPPTKPKPRPPPKRSTLQSSASQGEAVPLRPILKGSPHPDPAASEPRRAAAAPVRRVAVPPSPPLADPLLRDAQRDALREPQRKSVGFASPTLTLQSEAQTDSPERAHSPWHHRNNPTQV